MKNGFVKVATFTPKIKVADTDFNADRIIEGIELADEKNVQVLTFPKLCVTGSTCGELFNSDTLLNGAKFALKKIAKATKNKKMLVFVGLPLRTDFQTVEAVAGICDGKVLGFVPQESILDATVYLDGEKILMSENLLFCEEQNPRFTVGVGVKCARISVDLSAENEISGGIKQRRFFVQNSSYNHICAYCYANAGDGESTTDFVFSGHSLIAENGKILGETLPFENGLLTCDVDLEYIDSARSSDKSVEFSDDDYVRVEFSADRNIEIERVYDKTPFIIEGEEELLLNIQAHGLKKRLEHVNAKTAVIGLSGGLDSTLAIIVAVKAMKLLGKPTTDVLAYTMPCFGTTSRTLENSIKLAKALGVSIKKVDITKSVKSHLKDLKHPLDVHDAAYENAQARERTQLLMDFANMYNGVVVGTGDLSELALGWATYNGDHMSNYAVNASIPKTLVRHLVEYVANNSKGKLKAVLLDVLDTPVSPELLPAVNSKISQKTEDLVGPYILHDFFLYNIIYRNSTPIKTYQIACKSFEGEFDKDTILKWLKTFVRRFFAMQFKRSCMPDGVMVTEVSFSPRGGLDMPSDAVSKLWLEELENI